MLASVPGVGQGILGLLVGDFGSASAVLREAAAGRLAAWSAAVRDRPGRRPLARSVVDDIARAARDGERRLKRLEELRLWTLTPFDAGYPARLHDLDPPPAVIHGWGGQALLRARRSVAVVGTRRPTPVGRMLATQVAVRLVECGAVVVSGLAVGIDGAAHAATVENGGQTVAVIGAGHTRPGPQAHDALRAEILDAGGAIVGEHHPDTKATRGTYPQRNRIIAALGDATVVVEAPVRSGALITARHALELGRTVLVVPGRPGDWSTAGSLSLLRETPARPLVGLDEMTADLGFLERDGASSFPDDQPADTPTNGPNGVPALALLGTAERAVAQRLCRGPAGLDLLVHDTGLPPAVVSGAVTLLLMRGWVQPLGAVYLASGPLLG